MQSKNEPQTGRGKRSPTGVQRLPLFMSAGRSRVEDQVVMSAITAREKQRYLRWASAAAGVTREEAEVMMLDRALGDFMKKDEGWQLEKAAAGGNGLGDVVDELASPGSPSPMSDGGARSGTVVAPGVAK